ncbi:Benzyl alcohol O-benzoyltransferase [Quillaja saponaria]|uniref:Benzyl alcohol O-benzoyltransferase n=1 Tax=Quillaja saponaria TaxID=32244 RepID=A0AAD7L414_QUISA|nr:Benzyl alcohol O-benzoyltransferase [Quillaja saponaria]
MSHFTLVPKEISAIRKHVQERCTTFELLTACLWKCRTVALEFDPEEIVRLSIIANLRGKKHQNLHIPSGYYGNGFGFPAVTSQAGPGQPGTVLKWNFIVSNNTRVGFGEIDFSWGKALCAGPARIAVPICLPEFAMERFCQELKRVIGKP